LKLKYNSSLFRKDFKNTKTNKQTKNPKKPSKTQENKNKNKTKFIFVAQCAFKTKNTHNNSPSG
jgi:hypothetical protein